jgi:hypothetical protein
MTGELLLVTHHNVCGEMAPDELMDTDPVPDELQDEFERLVLADSPQDGEGYPMTDAMTEAFVEAATVSRQFSEPHVSSFHQNCRVEPWPEDRRAQLAWYETLIALLIGSGLMAAADGPGIRSVVSEELDRLDC